MRGETSFGQWLKQRRKALDLTQQDLAERIGCSDTTIRKIEAGVRRPSKQIAELLIDLLKIPLDEREAFVSFARTGSATNLQGGLMPQDRPAGVAALSHHPTNNLPIQITPLIGREHEMAPITTYMRQDQVRLLTLTGPPGVGKTSLGLQVARQMASYFTDGVFFIPLAPISDPALVAPTIAKALGIADQSSEAMLEALAQHLRSKAAMLVLDNFEQVIDAAPVVAHLLQECPEVKLLVTSRAPLRIRGERQFAVPPLDVPDLQHLPTTQELLAIPAVALLVERAQAARPDFRLTQDNARAVAAICVHLEGLPLAIELAAARAKFLSPKEIEDRLDSRLKLLTGGPRDLPTRQQTLRAAIDWSYSLLNRGEQMLFARLGEFVGGANLPAIEAVCNARGDLPIELLDGLESLLDKSLLKQSQDAGGESRFSMLEMIREYALERLEESGEADEIRRLHAEYYIALAKAAESELRGPRQLAWLNRLEAEHSNIRAVFEWVGKSGALETGLQLAGALTFFWITRGHFIEGRQRVEHLLSRPEAAAATAGRARALLTASRLARDQSDHTSACTYAKESLAIWRELSNKEGIVRALNTLAAVHSDVGDHAAARPLQEEALAVSHQLGDKSLIVTATHSLSVTEHRAGNLERARALAEESLRGFQELGNEEGTALALVNSAHIQMLQGDYQNASDVLKSSLVLFHKLKEKRRIGRCFGDLAMVAYRQGQVERAVRLFAASEAVLDSVGARMVPETMAVWAVCIEAAREQLGEEHFSAAWKEGLRMTMEQATTYALQTDT